LAALSTSITMNGSMAERLAIFRLGVGLIEAANSPNSLPFCHNSGDSAMDGGPGDAGT